VTQNLLDDFVGDTETVKIRSQSAPKRVPAVPWNLLRFDCGPNHFCHQSIEVQRIPQRIAENKSSYGIPGTSSMPVEKEFQLRDHRNGSFALLPFRLADLVPPYGLLYLDGETVVALPKESTDFTLAGARESRDSDDRRGYGEAVSPSGASWPRTVKRPHKASSGREQLCYVSSKGTEKLYLIFEYGEVDATFYLFAGGRSWHGREFCASSEKISRTLSTPSGLRLGLTRKQVEAILGKPDMVADNRFVYFRENERKTTADEFERLRRDYPEQLSDKDAHEKFDSYTVQTYIEARFTGSGLNYLVVSTLATD
jgi:hypothetical protein